MLDVFISKTISYRGHLPSGSCKFSLTQADKSYKFLFDPSPKALDRGRASVALRLGLFYFQQC